MLEWTPSSNNSYRQTTITDTCNQVSVIGAGVLGVLAGGWVYVKSTWRRSARVKRERKRETERDRDRDSTETEREREREREREKRERERETETETERQTDRDRNRDRQTDRDTETQTDRDRKGGGSWVLEHWWIQNNNKTKPIKQQQQKTRPVRPCKRKRKYLGESMEEEKTTTLFQNAGS